jgi:hypothetical protein
MMGFYGHGWMWGFGGGLMIAGCADPDRTHRLDGDRRHEPRPVRLERFTTAAHGRAVAGGRDTSEINHRRLPVGLHTLGL